MRLLLFGDVMCGRAIQLTLPYQTEGYENITDSVPAFYYLVSSLQNSFEVPKEEEINKIRELNLDGSYLWDELLDYDFGEDIRLLNIETAITLSIDKPEKKGITYHMNAENLVPLFTLWPKNYVFSLANNHALDFGVDAFLSETLEIFHELKIPYVGAQNILEYKDIEIVAFGTGCSGVPSSWSKYISYLPPITSDENVERGFHIIKRNIQKRKKRLRVLSIHWGPNWAHESDGHEYRRRLAHKLIDELGFDLIYGHSSHHIRGLELYKGRLILYGCGDVINDYEEIGGHEEYSKVGGVFVVDLRRDGRLANLMLLPVKMQKLQLKVLRSKEERRELIEIINSFSMMDSKENAYFLSERNLV